MSDGESANTKSEPCDEHLTLLVPSGEEVLTPPGPTSPRRDLPPTTSLQERTTGHRERATLSRDNSRSGSREPSPGTRDPPRASNRASGSLDLKVATQNARVKLLESLLGTVTQSVARDFTPSQLDNLRAQSTDLWNKFSQVHDAISETCTPEFLSGPYVTGDVFSRAFYLHRDITSRLSRYRDEIQPSSPGITASGGTAAIGRENLPKISLPTFTGDFSSWISFRDLFTSLVRDNASLTDVERMHYLRTATSGEAAKLIASLAIEAESFATAWEILCDRYNDTRVLIRSHLDSIFRTTVISPNSARDLRTLIHDVSEAYNSLRVLGAPIEHWDWVLEYAITRRLDTSSRVAWETKAGQSPDRPKLAELRAFLTNRARALEGSAVSTGPPQSRSGNSSTGSGKSASGATSRSSARAHAATTGSSQTCSLCQQAHFIVACPTFRELSNEQRREKVQSLRLCFNCLGRHNVASCQTTTKCKECERKHHTMIHVGWTRDGGTPSRSGKSGEASGASSAGPSSSGSA